MDPVQHRASGSHNNMHMERHVCFEFVFSTAIATGSPSMQWRTLTTTDLADMLYSKPDTSQHFEFWDRIATDLVSATAAMIA